MSNPLSTSSFKACLEQMNELGRMSKPFFFLLDYEGQEGLCLALDELDASSGLMFSTEHYHFPATLPKALGKKPFISSIKAEDFSTYEQRFKLVHKAINNGDSFLLNLSLRTPITLSTSLEQLFPHCEAPYKLHFPHRFLSFSPECFVRIQGDKISTYPMKGTIDAEEENAKEKLLTDYKESCEHCTIVDLMRNDLNRVAEDIHVKRFKFLSLIQTLKGSIYQMSSEVEGKLPKDWRSNIGDIFGTLLPAGSISGAPKLKTCEVIRQAEGNLERGFYTGVWGVFDGKNLDSAVLIRFIEQDEAGNHYYRSGGGITINSQAEEEYAECLKKIYLPIP